MSIFSLNWFKSRKQQQLEDLKVEEQELRNALLRQQFIKGEEQATTTQLTTVVPTVKLTRTIKLVNDVLTVVLTDGGILSKIGATHDDYIAAVNARSEEQLIEICSTSEVVAERKRLEREKEKAEALRQGMKILETTGDFEIQGDSIYLKGISRSLPQILIEEFLLIVNKYNANIYRLAQDEEYQSLKRFFMWCCLNPRAEVANELYRFLKENSFRITKQGFFVALRNVVTLHGSPELVHFVSNAFNKVRAVWKKNPADYSVYLKDGEYTFIRTEDTYLESTELCEACDGEGESWDDINEEWYTCEECYGSGEYTNTIVRDDLGQLIGNLKDLYADLPNRAENRFTDDWTKTFDIRIGRLVNMPMKDCNWSTQDCAAAGLHFTSDQIHYVGCGDQSVLVLINPMKVVGIGQHKGRCYEYLPIMTVPREEATEILHDLDFDTLALDEDYAIHELESLTEKAKEGFTAEASKHSFNLPSISTIEIENIVASLEEMKSEISNRVRMA